LIGRNTYLDGLLGEDYAKALWKVHPQINPSADYVMYWWDRAADLLIRKGTRLRRFGFVTTNSITQVFQRRVVERYLKADPPVSLVLAIPDHPWTKASKDAAAVRIAMTVAQIGTQDGVLREVVREKGLNTDEPKIEFTEKEGIIHADLTIGADVTKARSLLANEALCSPGVKLHGDGFIVSQTDAKGFGLGRLPGLDRYIREYRNGRDLTARPRGVMAIDLWGLTAEEVRKQFPKLYQHLLETVKPERDRNNRASYRNNWWLFGEPRRELRPALANLKRYIVTVETMKHRLFQFLEASILPDNKLVTIAAEDAFVLGVLSSRFHVVWAVRSGGWLGAGNDSVYVKSRCFDSFPFPDTSKSLKSKVSVLANELDDLRKLILEEHPDLTLTSLYNILEEIKSGVALAKKSRDIKDRGRVMILKDLHEQIDVAVASAFGWSVDLSEEDILQRLVKLNVERSMEERRGLIRWLRPDYQIGKIGPLAHNADRVQTITVAGRSRLQRTFPTEEKAQAGEVLDLLARSRQPLTPRRISERFKNGDRIAAEIEDVLKSLDRLGQAETFDNGRSYFRAAT
jgi:hypothetical protein